MSVEKKPPEDPPVGPAWVLKAWAAGKISTGSHDSICLRWVLATHSSDWVLKAWAIRRYPQVYLAPYGTEWVGPIVMSKCAVENWERKGGGMVHVLWREAELKE